MRALSSGSVPASIQASPHSLVAIGVVCFWTPFAVFGGALMILGDGAEPGLGLALVVASFLLAAAMWLAFRGSTIVVDWQQIEYQRFFARHKLPVNQIRKIEARHGMTGPQYLFITFNEEVRKIELPLTDSMAALRLLAAIEHVAQRRTEHLPNRLRIKADAQLPHVLAILGNRSQATTSSPPSSSSEVTSLPDPAGRAKPFAALAGLLVTSVAAVGFAIYAVGVQENRVTWAAVAFSVIIASFIVDFVVVRKIFGNANG